MARLILALSRLLTRQGAKGGKQKEARTRRDKPLTLLIRAAVTRADGLAWLLLVAALLSLAALPAFDRQAKFDEKSLMVGGAVATFG
jgi:hypothetical protein